MGGHGGHYQYVDRTTSVAVPQGFLGMDAFGAGYLPDLRALQSGLLDWLKDLYCSLPASGVSLSGRGYDGLGGGAYLISRSTPNLAA